MLNNPHIPLFVRLSRPSILNEIPTRTGKIKKTILCFAKSLRKLSNCKIDQYKKYRRNQ